MKTITLTQGKSTIVDDEDYPLLSRIKWHCGMQGANRDIPYAMGAIGECQIRMCRLILAAKKSWYVNHINGNTLDNRKSNLRVGSMRQMLASAPPHSGRSSQYKGVRKLVKLNRWEVHIGSRYLGTFNNEKAAAMAYDEAARKIYRGFAWLNFPEKHNPKLIGEHRRSQKLGGRGPRLGSISGFKGVAFHKPTARWHSSIYCGRNSRQFSLCYHKTAEDAARVYDAAARLVWGNNCYLNFPDEHDNIGLPRLVRWGLATLPDIDPKQSYNLFSAADILKRSYPEIVLLVKHRCLKAKKTLMPGDRYRYGITGKNLLTFAKAEVARYQKLKKEMLSGNDPSPKSGRN